jgi:hypothetical protein
MPGIGRVKIEKISDVKMGRHCLVRNVLGKLGKLGAGGG